MLLKSFPPGINLPTFTCGNHLLYDSSCSIYEEAPVTSLCSAPATVRPASYHIPRTSLFVRPFCIDPLSGPTVSNKMESIYFFPFSFHDRRLLGSRKIFQSSSPTISPSMQSQPVGSMEVPYTPKTSFPLTLAIVLAALLCTLLCLLVRYRHCCRRSRVVLEPSLHPAVGGNISMTKIDIEALPTTVYHTGLPFSDMDCAICLSESTGMVCPICLSEFVEGEKLRVLPGCCHSFHVDCVDGWLISNSTCPSCRQSLLDVRLKKSIGVTDPAAEAAQSAQIQVNERNESVTVTHTVQSFLG